MRQAQTTINLNGHTFTVGRLPPSAATELFFLLARGVGPSVAEVMAGLGVSVNAKGGFSLSGVRMEGLAAAVERLVRSLSFADFQAVAEKALVKTTVNGDKCFPLLDAYLGGVADYFTLVWKVLEFQYSDFSAALGGLLSSQRAAQTPSASEGSSTSAGPSGAS